jgi:hypothetical protein
MEERNAILKEIENLKTERYYAEKAERQKWELALGNLYKALGRVDKGRDGAGSFKEQAKEIREQIMTEREKVRQLRMQEAKKVIELMKQLLTS